MKVMSHALLLMAGALPMSLCGLCDAEDPARAVAPQDGEIAELAGLLGGAVGKFFCCIAMIQVPAGRAVMALRNASGDETVLIFSSLLPTPRIVTSP